MHLPDKALYYGDNLDWLREFPEEAVDLVYLDPPFNSNADYNVIFKEHKTGTPAKAQITAFEDTWQWSDESARELDDLVHVHSEAAEFLDFIVRKLGHNSLSAYMVMMSSRLVELRRVLRPTGSIYLHCDPTASHYLKILLDLIFVPDNFVSEIVWRRHNARGTTGRWPRVHDTILQYRKSGQAVFHSLKVRAEKSKLPHTLVTAPDGRKYQTYELTAPGVTKEGESGKPWRGFDPASMGRHWANSHSQMDAWDDADQIHWPTKHGFPRRRAAQPFDPESRTVTVGDVWTDIDRINQTAKERLGYPTQKPVALLERIVEASSAPGDLVLDPFCGCGTAVVAAEKLGRRWIGIDVTHLAVALMKARLRRDFELEPGVDYLVDGMPETTEAAQFLFDADPHQFQFWAVGALGAQPYGAVGSSRKGKKGGDTGIDGQMFFRTPGADKLEKAIISVKGGKNLGPSMVRDLRGVIEREKAAFGVFVCMDEPTRGMREEAAVAGVYRYGSLTVPKLQIITVAEIIAGKQPKLPAGSLNVSLETKTVKTTESEGRRQGQTPLFGGE